MIHYIDSSVLLRVVLGQAGRLLEWRKVTHGVSSSVAEVESLRTLDRLRLESELEEEDFARRRGVLLRILDSMTLVEPTRPVLARAAQPLPTALGTLDAIHLATALLYRDAVRQPVTVATHDRALARAARAHAFRVIGAERHAASATP
ncbi:MAG: PIN domain-containing protein [Acidithiobacillales bacterium]